MRKFGFEVGPPSQTPRLVGKRAVLAFGLVLLVASYLLRWYWNDGIGTSLSLDDRRIAALLETVSVGRDHPRVALEGTPENAWLSSDSRGYKLNVVAELDGYPWHVQAVFSENDVLVDYSVQLAIGILLPQYLARLGLLLVALWLVVAFLWPRLFGRKCPDCPGDFIRPAVLYPVETTVYPGGWDDEGYSLSPIVRRDYVCDRCGYRQVTYHVPPLRSPGKVFRTPFPDCHTTISQDQVLQRILDDWWATNKERARFHTYDEWLAYYNELKASEHEERPGK